MGISNQVVQRKLVVFLVSLEVLPILIASLFLRKFENLHSKPTRAADLRPTAFGSLFRFGFSNLLGNAHKSKTAKKIAALPLFLPPNFLKRYMKGDNFFS